MKTIRLIITLALVAITGAYAGDEILLKTFVQYYTNYQKPIFIKLKAYDTYQKITNVLNQWTLFQPDVQYEIELNNKTINLLEQKDNTISEELLKHTYLLKTTATRIWHIKPQGNLLQAKSSFDIAIISNAFIKDAKYSIKEKIKKFFSPNEYFAVTIKHDNKDLTDYDRMPSYRKSFDPQKYTVIINKTDSADIETGNAVKRIIIQAKTTYQAFNETIIVTNKNLTDIADEYKNLCDLAPDVTTIITGPDKTTIKMINELHFNSYGNAYANATLSRSWAITPKNRSIKPFTITLGDQKSIKSVKNEIINTIKKQDENLKTKKLVVVITRKKNKSGEDEALGDDDTMPLYTERFDPKDYSVHIFEPASDSFLPTIDNAQGVFVHEDTTKAQQQKFLESLPIKNPQQNLKKTNTEKSASQSLWQRLASWFSLSKKGK